MSLRRMLSAFALAAVGACGCSQARYVSRSPEGGVVAIPQNNDYWPTHYRTEAENLMRKCCPEGYAVVREEEAVVGQTTTVNATNNDRVTSTISQSHDVTEWHIHFRSIKAPPVVAQGPGLMQLPAAVVQTSATLPAEPVPVAAH